LDSVQVIRVAADQNCKHLTLLPGTNQMVTTASRRGEHHSPRFSSVEGSRRYLYLNIEAMFLLSNELARGGDRRRPWRNMRFIYK